MIGLLLALSVSQDPSPWRLDVTAARESALKQGRPCVILLALDSL
jgi:hypothetical protein